MEVNLLQDILEKLKLTQVDNKSSKYNAPKIILPIVSSLINNLEKQLDQLSNHIFKDFISQAHDVFVRGDSSIRSSILRTIRFSIQNEESIKDLIEEQFQWLIITSFERDGDYNIERIQALKLMGKLLSIAPNLYPISFARSLVAVANSKEDSFRKICIETLRELSLGNPKLVATVNGYSCLLEAVIEPITQELADNILLTILYLLNDPNIRRFVMHHIDLRVLLSSFTDLDTDSSNLTSKWNAAKSAVIIMMRSWVGIVLLTSDEMGLNTLVKMLRDPKVPSATQDIILDIITDILSPADSKTKSVNKNRSQQIWSSIKGSKLQTNTSSSTSLSNGTEITVDKSIPPTSNKNNTTTNTVQVKQQSSSSAIPTSVKPNSYSFSDFLFSHNSTVDNGDLAPAVVANQPHKERTKAGSPTNLMSPNSEKRPLSFNFTSIFNRASSPTTIGGKFKRGSVPAIPSISSKAFGGRSISHSTDTEEVKKPVPSYVDANRYSPIRRRGSVNNTSNVPTSASNSSLASASSTGNNGNNSTNNTIFDPIFNLMDNYVALLSCALLHVDLIQSLYFLGTHGTVITATKSRNLMVVYLRVLANILPERRCSELLTIPSLIEFAATTSARSTTNRAHKSSQILIALAEAFSLMPLKQVSGSHISGLSSNPLTRVSSDRERSVSSSQEFGRRQSILSSSTNMTQSTANNNNSQLQNLSNKSNFSPLNIQTIFELAEEIKIASFSNISGASNSGDASSSANGATADVIKSMRSSITSLVDKNDFIKQMEQSKVIGKDGKEPFKWDWMTISDMLEYSFHHPDRLSDALKTKWVRRVCGFYRCSTEEKGYFANLDWEPTNLQYLESASNLYSVLLRDEAGLSFLGSDRRGMLFNEISSEIDSLASIASATSKSGSINSPIPKNVFRLSSCNSTMAREFFTLLGRILKTTGSRHLLEGTNIFNNLSKLGSLVSLDYLSRLTVTSLSFTDGGFLSRHLLQLWTTQNNCSDQLRLYIHSLLRVLSRAKPSESYNWCIDAIANQLILDQKPSGLIYKTLEEAIHNKLYLKTIISKRPKIIKDPKCQDLLIRFLSIPEGIEFLSESNWLDNTLTMWQEKGCENYVNITEEKISVALSKINTSITDDSNEMVKAVVPIPIQIPDIMNDVILKQTAYSTSSSNSNFQDNYDDPNSTLSVDLHGLFRVPWNIEIKLTAQAGYQAQGTGSSGNTNAEYLKIDTMLDSSEIVSAFCGETTSDATRLIKVRGIVLDSKGAPVGQSIAQNKIISSSLMAGTCPIFNTGRVQSVSDVNVASKRNNVNIRRGSTITHQSTTSQMRESLSQVSHRGSLSGISGIVTDVDDVPVTFQQENSFDWSHCKPGHRQGNIIELEDSKFAVSVPGEPVIWIFSRRSPALSNKKPPVTTSTTNQPPNNSKGNNNTDLGNVLFSNNPNRYDFSRSGGLVYLIEVQYYLRLETGQALFVPMPRHIYGELSRTLEGCAYLAQRNIIFDLVSVIHQSKQTTNDFNREMRSALWALGHIGSSDYGFTAIINADPYFVEWCIQNVTANSNFSLRGTFFYVLGLISRTSKGSRKLFQLHWDSAPMGSNSAVAFPKDPSALFQALRDQQITTATNHSCFQNNTNSSVLTPFSNTNDIEMEILNLVAKLPGVIIYRDCRVRLDQIKKEKPEVFMSRKLYVEVHKMLETYTYKLTARRDILNLFSNEARYKITKKEEQQ